MSQRTHERRTRRTPQKHTGARRRGASGAGSREGRGALSEGLCGLHTERAFFPHSSPRGKPPSAGIAPRWLMEKPKPRGAGYIARGHTAGEDGTQIRTKPPLAVSKSILSPRYYELTRVPPTARPKCQRPFRSRCPHTTRRAPYREPEVAAARGPSLAGLR